MSLRANILLFILSSAIVSAAMLMLFVDVFWFHDGVKETSFTEISQELILALIVSLHMFMARRRDSMSHCGVLIAAFFTCMFIREMDFLFDELSHGSWVWFALGVAVLSIVYCLLKPALTVNQLVKVMSYPSFGMMLSGILSILVFSRIFGMGMLWDGLMIDGYNRLVKNMVEEGTELFGYILCLISTVWYFYLTRKSSKKSGNVIIR